MRNTDSLNIIPACMTAFPSADRHAFNGLVLAVVRTNKGEKGILTVKAESPGLKSAVVKVESR